jgi:sugar-specific transcriptional regulator TrmB
MIDWNKRNGGFLSPESVYEDQLGNLSMQINDLQQQLDKYKNVIDKIKELIKSSASYKGICTQPQTDTFSYILELLEEVE